MSKIVLGVALIIFGGSILVATNIPQWVVGLLLAIAGVWTLIEGMTGRRQ